MSLNKKSGSLAHVEQGFFIMSGSCLSADLIQKPDHSACHQIYVCLKAVVVRFDGNEFRVLISRRGLFPISERDEFVRFGMDYQNRPVSVEPDRVVEGQKSVHAIIAA